LLDADVTGRATVSSCHAWSARGRPLCLLRLAASVGALLAATVAADAQSPGDAARTLLRNYQDDPARIDRARDLLEAALARAGTADTATLVTLSRAWFLFAENRARTEDARLAAYERGRSAAQRAIADAPDSADAHLWYAINLGSWAQAKGLLRSLITLKTIRQEVDTVLRLDPDSIEGHVMAGSLFRDLPALMGGDPAQAEQHFKRARALDPHLTGVRIELALLYSNTGRIAEARRELEGVLDEPAPTDRPRWLLKEAPRARAMLEPLRDKP
jgi:tetratricopeptide (TPR) repeat protein